MQNTWGEAHQFVKSVIMHENSVIQVLFWSQLVEERKKYIFYLVCYKRFEAGSSDSDAATALFELFHQIGRDGVVAGRAASVQHQQHVHLAIHRVS